MKKLLTLLFLGLSCSLFAQTVKVSGTVSGTDGMSLPGVYVMEENTSNAVSTDIDGYYSLDAKVGSNLLFSYIGYKTQIIPVTGAAVINVILEEDSALLEEVVVVGYGTQKKSVVTAAIAKVSSDDLKNVAPVRIDNALKGLTSGVTVTSSSGQPGGLGTCARARRGSTLGVIVTDFSGPRHVCACAAWAPSTTRSLCIL